MNEPSAESFWAVIDLLRKSDYDFHTIEAIQRDTGVPESEVEKIVNDYPHYVRKCWVKQKKGGILYTATENKPKIREMLAYAKAFTSDSGNYSIQ